MDQHEAVAGATHRVPAKDRQRLLTVTAAPGSRWPRVLPIVVVSVIGLVITVGIVVVQGTLARSAATAEVHTVLDRTASNASASLATLNGSVTTLAGWLSLNTTVSERTFVTLAERAVGQRDDLQSLEFAPVVRADERDAFERRMARRGYSSGITEPSAGALIPAAPRDLYLPLEFVAPRADTIVHGLDALSRVQNRASILRAAATGDTVIGIPMPLVEDNELALLTYTPVYKGDREPRNAAQRRKTWTGMVIGVVRVREWIDAAARNVSASEVEMQLVDRRNDDMSLLWFNAKPGDSTASNTSEIMWNGQQFLMLTGVAGTDLLSGVPMWRTRATLLGGLLLTLTLSLATWKWVEAQSSRKRAEASERRSQTLQILAETDPVTGLPHRDGLRRWLGDWVHRNPHRPIALVVIDLNNFKEVNAVAGHLAGDMVLESIGRRLSVLASDCDTAVGRMGGDQFIVLRAGDRGSLAGLASLIHAMISEPLQAADLDVELTSALGVAVYPDDGADLDSLILHADIAVAEAKKKPGNSATHFHPVLMAEGQQRRRQALALRMAVRDPDEHFLLEYQPQVDLLTGQVVGAEALLRWRQPDGSIEYPGAFLALATQQGLMPELGQWVLEQACATLASWPQPCRLVVAVNVEAQQIRRTFASLVTATVQRCGIDPTRLTLEVTEAAAMDPGARAQLEVLRNAGMGVAIDDFGTGFSSLSRLTEVPACELKIDRTFIAGLGQSPESLDIVQAIQALATALDLNIVAEGVETPEQAQILVDHGVRVAQGFLFSRSVSAARVIALCERGFAPFTPLPAASPIARHR